MERALAIVVPCTGRKRQPPLPDLEARRLPRGALAERAATWRDRLSGADGVPLAASTLYCGDHWTQATSLADLAAAAGYRSQLWVASAGYGLIPAATPVHPYSATFALGHPDSVVSRSADAARWWRHLAAWRPSKEASKEALPRHLDELAADGTHVLVAGSTPYLAAFTEDLVALARRAPRRHLVVSSRPVAPELRHLPAPRRLRLVLGGTASTTNVRAAARWLKHLPAGAGIGDETALAGWRTWLGTVAAEHVPQRRSLTDEQIAVFITRHLAQQGTSRTGLLRHLRDSGHRCEQGRFARIYHDTVGSAA